jgi:hypothetical protein
MPQIGEAFGLSRASVWLILRDCLARMRERVQGG